MKVYKVGKKKRYPAALSGLAERFRVGDGGAVVMGSNPARSLNFFSSTFETFLSFLAG